MKFSVCLLALAVVAVSIVRGQQCKMSNVGRFNAYGGTQIFLAGDSGQMTGEQCAALCAADAECQAVDYNTGNQDCWKHLTTAGKVHDYDCCDRYEKDTSDCIASGDQECSGSYCYAKTAKKNWDAANAECSAYGFHLAKIDNNSVRDEILAVIVDLGISDSQIWVGASDKQNQDTFVWRDGTAAPSITDATFWRDTMVSGNTNQDCVEITKHWQLPNGAVANDKECSTSYYGLCQRPQ